jgi:putative ABC transport system permease protein
VAYLEFLKLALFAITRNKTRAFLTMLGIIIGVGSVIAMIGIGSGSQKASKAIIESMGTNMIMIFPSSQGHGGGGPVGLGGVENLTDDDAFAIQRELPGSVAAATPHMQTSRPLVFGNQNWLCGSVTGVSPDYLTIKSWNLERGRYFNEQEVRSQAKVCVIGKTVQDNLFPGGEDPIGQTIRVGKLPFEIIGVLARKGGGPMGDQDDTLHAPYTTIMRKVMGRDHISRIIASSLADKADLAEAEITALLRQRHRLAQDAENDFTIRKQNDWIEASAEQSKVLTLFLAMAASISLIVGGIGISNIMLVSVTERTREIGIRRALGATQRSVLWQFLTEAVVLALLGGLVGVLLAMLTVWILMTFTSLPAVTEPWAVALGLGFSAVVGVTAGFLPALKAAKLDVIDALRYE